MLSNVDMWMGGIVFACWQIDMEEMLHSDVGCVLSLKIEYTLIYLTVGIVMSWSDCAVKAMITPL